jgi:hypothetical protein
LDFHWEVEKEMAGVVANYYRTVKKLRDSLEGNEQFEFKNVLRPVKGGDEKPLTELLLMYRPLILK